MNAFPDEVSVFEIIVAILGIIGGLYTLWGLLRPLRLDLYPADTISFIASNKGFVSKFHLRCNLVNKTVKMGIVHLLEAEVRFPTNEIKRFRWKQFFTYQVSDNGQIKLLPGTEPYPIEVKPKDSHLVFIEFQAISSIESTKWIPGRYEFKIIGWVNRQDRSKEPNLEAVFHIEIDEGKKDKLTGRYDPPEAISLLVEEWKQPNMITESSQQAS